MEVFRPTKGPANVFWARLPTGNYRKLKRNVKNPGKFNFNNTNTAFYQNTNNGFKPTELQNMANKYVRAVYAQTGYGPLGGEKKSDAQIFENVPIPPALIQRKNVTNAVLKRYISGPDKPKESNANSKRIPRLTRLLKEGRITAKQRELKEIGNKSNALEGLIKNEIKSMNYEQVGAHGKAVDEAWVAYQAAVNKGFNTLNNAVRQLTVNQRSAFNTEVKGVQAAVAARKAQLLANEIAASLTGKTGKNLS